MLPRRFIRFALVTALLVWAASAAETALDRYVKQPDPTYAYKIVNTAKGEGYTAYIVEMTSQTWRKPSEVDRTVWKHWLTIVKPDRVDHTTGYLFITGGSTRDKAPAAPGAQYVEIAMTTHSVAAELQDVPNEPLTFLDSPTPRSEDGIIAYTWIKFMETGDENWPLRLPMTKAAVRALDTVTAVAAKEGNVKVEKFLVSGGSKRGWTSWTTAAVDPRVAAVLPASIDLLNLVPSFEHHWKVYGFWAPAVKDYVISGVMDWTGTPEYKKLLEIEEPYNYRDRLTMPKYMVQAAGDQFFLPDSSRFYFDDLQGEKYLRYIPNTDHSLRNSNARESMLAYYEALVNNKPRPKFGWTFEANGDIRVTSKDKPTAVKLWQATNAEHRDFRLEMIGPQYKSTDLHDEGGGVWVGHVRAPEKGWTAYFVELTFPSGGKYPFMFTTAVRVNPDTEPFPAYVPKRPPRHSMNETGVYNDFRQPGGRHVLARENTKEMIAESTAAHHTYTAHDELGDATGLSFVATNNNGVYDIGDHAPMVNRTRLVANLPFAAHIRILHNGAAVAQADDAKIDFTATETGEYHLDATLGGKPWVETEPIYLDAVEGRGITLPSTAIPAGVEVKKDITYAEGKPEDAAKHKLDIYLPKDGKNVPVLIFLHGGSWRSGDRSNYPALGSRFAKEGFAVVVPSYRLMPGAPHPAQIEDATAAVDWTIRHIAEYGGDPKRIWVSGHSAGGHLAAYVGLEKRFWPNLKGVLALSGVYDVSSIGGFKDGPDGSPMKRVAAGAPPFLVTYCENDYPTLPGQARKFTAELKSKDIPVELVYVPGKNHINEIVDVWKDDDPTARAILGMIKK